MRRKRKTALYSGMLVPGLMATIALAGASHGAVLDHACTGHAAGVAPSHRSEKRYTGRSDGAFTRIAIVQRSM